MSWGVIDWDQIGIVIRAVEGKREQMVADTLAAVQSFAPNVKVHYHREGFTFAEDYVDTMNAWDRDFKWLLQFEDDIWLAPDFPDLALRALEDPRAVNSAVVTFYNTFSNAIEQGRDGFKVVAGPGRAPSAQALCFKSSELDDHNEWVLDALRTGKIAPATQTDVATGAWVSATGRSWCATAPSIVQHIGNAESLVGHSRNWNRMAPSYTEHYGERHL